MKRAGNLYHRIAEIENLCLAFWKAAKGKGSGENVCQFRINLSEELQQLRREFLDGNVPLGNYHYFTIYDPKERVICAADFRERVIQHAVINVCEPYFEKYQMYDSFACRKGKGVDACLKRTQYFCRKYKWFLKMDVHKYFDSIHHKVLLNLLARRFKDPELLDFFAKLIDTYEVQPGCGLPIGNLTSQYFANLYLATLDHMLKNVLKIEGYVRYMDDFILFSNDKEKLIQAQQTIVDFLQKKLKLLLNHPLLNQTKLGFSFLSYRIFPNKIRLTQKAKKRFIRKITIANATENAESALSLLAFVNRADSTGFRYNLFYGDSTNGSNRVIRGGSWNNNADNCRVANRNNNNPDNRNNNNGFRLALVPAQKL